MSCLVSIKAGPPRRTLISIKTDLSAWQHVSCPRRYGYHQISCCDGERGFLIRLHSMFSIDRCKFTTLLSDTTLTSEYDGQPIRTARS
mgnify:CR=1 FL=1